MLHDGAAQLDQFFVRFHFAEGVRKSSFDPAVTADEYLPTAVVSDDTDIFRTCFCTVTWAAVHGVFEFSR
ncbi:hypothetical protein D3C75_1303330 [compost metagenome]